MDLDDQIYFEIIDLCEIADSMVEDCKYCEAINLYNKALDLVPLPKSDWETSTWIYTALGDTYFIKGDYERSVHYLFEAMNCPEGLSNPYILLKLGQSFFEGGEVELAREYLIKAFMIDGYKIFEGEDEKYFNSIIDII